MLKQSFAQGVIILILGSPSVVFATELAGAKGQNYDRVVFDLPAERAVQVSARVMTINRYPDSASSITVTDNGAPLLAPVANVSERWKETFSVSGEGRHEIVMVCKSLNSSPVYCSLAVDDAQGAAAAQ